MPQNLLCSIFTKKKKITEISLDQNVFEAKLFLDRNIFCSIDKPDAIENVAIGENTDIKIWSENRVKSSDLFVPEESVGHPHFTRISHGQVTDFI